MRVTDLIAKLKNFPPDAPVVIQESPNDYNDAELHAVTSVTYDEQTYFVETETYGKKALVVTIT